MYKKLTKNVQKLTTERLVLLTRLIEFVIFLRVKTKKNIVDFWFFFFFIEFCFYALISCQLSHDSPHRISPSQTKSS